MASSMNLSAFAAASESVISSTPEGVQVGESGLYPLGVWTPISQ